MAPRQTQIERSLPSAPAEIEGLIVLSQEKWNSPVLELNSSRGAKPSVDRGTWISIVLVVSVVSAFGLFWLVGNHANDRFRGSGFETRFPEKTLSYDVDKFRQLAASDVRKAYVVPLLFPLDLIVMLALAGSMSVAIWYWLGAVSPAWSILALVPLVYLLSDLAEDCLLAWMLQPDHVWPAMMIGVLKALTFIKLVSIVASTALTVAAFILWLFRAPHGSLG